MALPTGISSLVVGDIKLTLIPDGYHRCDPLASFLGSREQDWDAHRHLLDDRGRVVMTMGALLVELPDGRRALLDLGFGARTVILEALAMEFWGGRLLSSLASVGVTPEAVDLVAYSHLHSDHVGWTTNPDGALTFGRARHVMSRAEWEHWVDKPEAGGPSAPDIGALAERVDLIDGEATILPGVSIVPTPGHTAGHCSFLVSSGTERAVVLGDAIHCPLQISHPEWAFSADASPDAARRARERLLLELDAPDTVVVGPHFPEAVFGRVLAGTVPRQVAFDVAPPASPQSLAAEATPGEIMLPPLD